jgi:autotransporter-associated beta strand protein
MGSLIDSSAGLTKTGVGTLILTAANTYAGNTTISDGTLVVSQPTLAAGSIISVAAGAGLQLAFAQTNAVKGLILNGVGQPAGIYKAANATPYLTGSGSLQVGLGLNPTKLTANLTGASLAFSWPADHVGWTLLKQTNHPSLGVSSNPNDWMRLPESIVTNEINMPINQTNSADFYRLTYP